MNQQHSRDSTIQQDTGTEVSGWMIWGLMVFPSSTLACLLLLSSLSSCWSSLVSDALWVTLLGNTVSQQTTCALGSYSLFPPLPQRSLSLRFLSRYPMGLGSTTTFWSAVVFYNAFCLLQRESFLGWGLRVSVGFNPTQSTADSKPCWEQENSPPQGRAHQLVAQYQMVSPKNTHTGNITQTKQVLLRNLCTNIYIYVSNNN